MSIKLVKESGFSGVVTTITPTFDGEAVPVTFSLVGGAQAFGNDLVSIDSSGVITTNASFDDEGTFYFRYRVAITGQLNRYVEGNVKLIIAVEENPTITGPLGYLTTVVAGDVVATIVSLLPNSEFFLTPLESAGSNPASESESVDAIEIVGDELQWTGKVDPADLLDFNYRVSVVGSDAGCFGGGVEVAIAAEQSPSASAFYHIRGTLPAYGPFGIRVLIMNDVLQGTSRSAFYVRNPGMPSSTYQFEGVIQSNTRIKSGSNDAVTPFVDGVYNDRPNFNTIDFGNIVMLTEIRYDPIGTIFPRPF